MAADVSYARSPVGESASRHMLWLTQDELDAIGEEPKRDRHKVDHEDPATVERSREQTRVWNAWWDRICTASNARQREARQDPVWMEEYHRLLRVRISEGPAEMAKLEAGWAEFEAKHPTRGLTDAEQAEQAANWKERWRLCRQHNALARKDPKDPTLPGILAAMKVCDRRNDELVSLGWSRPTFDAERETGIEPA
jgi:hypothetical protein